MNFFKNTVFILLLVPGCLVKINSADAYEYENKMLLNDLAIFIYVCASTFIIRQYIKCLINYILTSWQLTAKDVVFLNNKNNCQLDIRLAATVLNKLFLWIQVFILTGTFTITFFKKKVAGGFYLMFLYLFFTSADRRKDKCSAYLKQSHVLFFASVHNSVAFISWKGQVLKSQIVRIPFPMLSVFDHNLECCQPFLYWPNNSLFHQGSCALNKLLTAGS